MPSLRQALLAEPCPAETPLRVRHSISTLSAKSGAGSKKVGVAGSLALNIVNGTRTEATVPAGAIVNAGTGDITVKAESTEAVTANAVSDAKAGTVGVGASVGINVLTTDHTSSRARR